jgi:hypothetical protein
VREYEAKKKTWERGDRKSAAPKPPKAPFRCMHEGEDKKFLRFATTLKIPVGSSITCEGLQRAKSLLENYLLNFLEVWLVQLHVIFSTSVQFKNSNLTVEWRFEHLDGF